MRPSLSVKNQSKQEIVLTNSDLPNLVNLECASMIYFRCRIIRNIFKLRNLEFKLRNPELINVPLNVKALASLPKTMLPTLVELALDAELRIALLMNIKELDLQESELFS